MSQVQIRILSIISVHPYPRYPSHPCRLSRIASDFSWKRGEWKRGERGGFVIVCDDILPCVSLSLWECMYMSYILSFSLTPTHTHTRAQFASYLPPVSLSVCLSVCSTPFSLFFTGYTDIYHSISYQHPPPPPFPRIVSFRLVSSRLVS